MTLLSAPKPATRAQYYSPGGPVLRQPRQPSLPGPSMGVTGLNAFLKARDVEISSDLTASQAVCQAWDRIGRPACMSETASSPPAEDLFLT